MQSRFWITLPLVLLAAAPAVAQLALPPVGTALERVTGTVGNALQTVDRSLDRVADSAMSLARQRTARLTDLVRRHPEAIELDAAGAPARKGELLVIAASSADLDQARGAGFSVAGTEALDELGVTITRLQVPSGMPLARAEKALRQTLPQAAITADTLHFPVGSERGGPSGPPPPLSGMSDIPVGVIDGAPGPSLGASAIQGFARGAPSANDHGSAIVSLLHIAGARRVLVADVYGTDPAGGNALAIGRGLNWLLQQHARVVSISLVGPANPIVQLAISAATKRGVVLVAAVGNDGPAAPPAYPASYPGVVAVTGVDGRNRALIEAGRALHLDYAAPGADMAAANAAGRWVRVRGTSYAAPLVAARAAAAVERGSPVIPTLDAEAVHLGAKRPDRVYGRGLLCGTCRRRP